MNKDVSKGFSIGVIAPIVTLVIYIAFFLEKEIETALLLFEENTTLSHHISLSVFLTNIVLFFMHIKMEKERVSKGILGATFIYTFIVLYIKLF